MSKGLEALKDLIDTMPLVFIETNSMKYVEIIEKELKDFSRLKDAIERRIKSYKKELETGCDFDGEKLTETNKLITLNLFNLLTALESCYKEV